jgi:hypothetical protein
MSDDTHQEQESVPENDTPLPQDTEAKEQPPIAQEFFGSFPEQREVTSSPSAYDHPEFYNTTPPYGMPPSYGTPPPYGYSTPPPFGYAGVPPQGYYGQSSNEFRYGPEMRPATPLTLGAAIRQLPRQYWRVFTHPRATTFIEEEGKAAWNIIWIQLLFLGIVETIVVLLVVFLEFFLFQALMPGSMMSTLSTVLPIVAIILILVCLAFVPVSFFFGASIYYLIARAFGGKGTFLSHCYNYSLVIMPITIASVALSIIPCLGSLATFAGVVYEVVLLIFMIMGVHRLSGGRSSATVLIPVITGVVLVVGAYIVYIALILSMLPHS